MRWREKGKFDSGVSNDYNEDYLWSAIKVSEQLEESIAASYQRRQR